MKKLFWILSLSVLLFSSLVPNFTYANTEAEDEAINILTDILGNLWQTNDLNDDFTNITEWNNTSNLEFIEWDYSTYPRIVRNQESWLITIYSDDHSYWITMKDKNIWAESTEDAWNYYKWWNNNVATKENFSTISTITDLNAWWWWNDLDTSDENIRRWYNKSTHKATNLELRKWPCEEWYHVPSAWEWNEIVKLYYTIKWYESQFHEQNGWVQIYDYRKLILNDLKLIPSGILANSTIFDPQVTYLQSSSYKSAQYNSRYQFYETNESVIAIYAWRDASYAMPVRCFKNDFVPISEYAQKTKTITYNPNWWAFPWMDKNETIEKTYEYKWLEYDPIYDVQIPNKEKSESDNYSGYMFAWWYTEDWTNNNWWEEFDINTSNTDTAYAKWLPFNDLKLTLWDIEVTIMDRNLWAEEVAEWTYSSTSPESNSKLWCYYQRWNNYWICSDDEFPKNRYDWTITNENHETNPWWPNNYYYSNKYIYNNSKLRRETEENKNLWWWEDEYSLDNDKKWPCPEWYHIPSETEWKSLYNKFKAIKESDPNYCTWEYSDKWKCFSKKIKAPYAWYRRGDMNGKKDSVWTDAKYRSTTPNSISQSFDLLWRNSEVYFVNYADQTDAIPIRCFKNNSKKIIFEGNGWNIINEDYYTYRWWEENTKIKQLPTKKEMIKENYTFKGRYTTTWFEDWTEVTTNDIKIDNKNITLYAKRKENPELTLKTNWWTFEDWTEEKTFIINDTHKKILKNENYENKLIRKTITFSWAESIELSWDWIRACVDRLNIYNCNKETDNNCDIYTTIIADSTWKLKIDETIPWDTVTVEADPGTNQYCSSAKFNITATSNWIEYYEMKEIPIITREWYEFLWWEAENWKFEDNNWWIVITQDATLTAKWQKHPEIKLNANWWKFENWTEEKNIELKTIYIKTLKNDEYKTEIVRETVIFTWVESIKIDWNWNISCVNTLNIYNCNKKTDSECNIYKTIEASNWVFTIDEIIPWDIVTVEAETWTCIATPKFNITAKSKWINYYETDEDLPILKRNWNEFLWWYDESWTQINNINNKPIINDIVLNAQWKALEEKAQETTTESVVYTNETTVTIWDDIQEEPINNLPLINLVTKEVENHEVVAEEEKITVQETEIQVTSGKAVEYQGWLEVYLEKTENEATERIEWTAKFSSPVAVKIPISSEAEYVKVQVKHGDEDFGFTWLTLNPVNECNNWEALNDKYNWENIQVTNNNWDKYALIYTCSASTFVAYTENTKQSNNSTSVSSPAAWGWRAIISTKSENKSTNQEHNSADTKKSENIADDTTKNTNSAIIENLKEQVVKVQETSLTRWEVAVMTNILLDVYPQLTENRELNEVSEACESYADEHNFTKDEKKAITRLCKLSIMWIHSDDNRPLEEFLVNNGSTNDEFSKVINRSLSTYTEKDFSVVKEALKKLEWDEENVVFGTVYDMFMSIKNIFS